MDGPMAADNRRMLAQELDELSGAIAELTDIARVLEDRIDPILRPSQPSPSTGAPADPVDQSSRSTVSSRIIDMTEQVASLQRRLKGLFGRVDL